MDPTGIIIGASIGVGVAIAASLNRKRSAALAPSIEAALKDRGELSVPALQETLQMPGMMKRGKLVLALNELIQQGKVETIDAPPGTPQLKKVELIKYRLRA